MSTIESCRWCDKLIPQCSCPDGPQTSGTLYNIACPYCGEQIEELWDGWDDGKSIGGLIECLSCEREARIYHVETVVELTLERVDEETTARLAALRALPSESKERTGE